MTLRFRPYPDYGTPGNPNMDPYYMTAEEEAEQIALNEYDLGVSEGRAAYAAEQPRSACPYRNGALREGWLDGYDN